MPRRQAALRGASVVLGYAAFYVAFFSPVLFGPLLLAPDDGWTFFLPAFLAGPVAWTDLLFAGFPVLADPQSQSFYPLARLFALLGVAGWDPFVVSAYVLASSFAYAYARAAGGSRLAAAAAGLVYGTSGFLVAHLRHATFIHTAAWLPLLLWGLEKLRTGARATPFAATALATTMSVLAGSPQILVYGLGLAGAYAVFAALAGPASTSAERGAHGPPSARRRVRFGLAYLAAAGAAAALGIGLAAVQLVPAAELAALSPRAALGYPEFGTFALSPGQLPLLLFPYLEGGAFGVPYLGPHNLAEISGWVGLLPPLLAGSAVIGGRPRGLAWFWAAAAVVALLLTLGTATPLGELAYRLPGYRLFRAPARHFLELSMAVSALVALGVEAVQRRTAGRRARVALVLLAGAASVIGAVGAFTGLAGAGLAEVPATTAALLVPGAVLVLSSAAFLAWGARPAAPGRRALLLAALAVDLVSFGWFFEWRVRAPSRADLGLPPAAEPLRDLLERTGQRLLAARGHVGRPAEIPVNGNRVSGIASPAGYNPLLQRRLAELLPVANWGAAQGPWASERNRALDLLAVRFVTIPAAAVTPDPVPRAGSGPPPVGVVLGSGCGSEEPAAWTFHAPPAARADSLVIVSSLLCSTGVPQGAPVLRVTLHGAADSVRVLRAGEDTAEWMFDCPGVREIVSHERPPPFGTYALPAGARPPEAGSCEWNAYVARLPLPAGGAPERVTLRWVGPHGAARVHRVALTGGGGGIVLDPETGPLLDSRRWGRVGRTRRGVLVLENRRALPRAWLAWRAVLLPPDEALRAIHLSVLPGGAAFDPREVALVERPVELGPAREGAAADSALSRSVRIVVRSRGEMQLRVRTPAPAILVTSDAWYPGWRATVDGRRVPVLRVDYALRGVRVPAGTHVVRFTFEPRSLRVGSAVTALSGLLLAAALMVVERRARGRGD